MGMETSLLWDGMRLEGDLRALFDGEELKLMFNFHEAVLIPKEEPM
jgi:hypothetical protein